MTSPVSGPRSRRCGGSAAFRLCSTLAAQWSTDWWRDAERWWQRNAGKLDGGIRAGLQLAYRKRLAPDYLLHLSFVESLVLHKGSSESVQLHTLLCEELCSTILASLDDPTDFSFNLLFCVGGKAAVVAGQVDVTE